MKYVGSKARISKEILSIILLDVGIAKLNKSVENKKKLDKLFVYSP